MFLFSITTNELDSPYLMEAALMLPTHRPPTHPGEMLLEEFLIPMGLSQVDLARDMGIPLQRLNTIIRAKRAVTADTAIRLSERLGMGPEFWLGLQMKYDLWHALQAYKAGKSPKRAAPQSQYMQTGRLSKAKPKTSPRAFFLSSVLDKMARAQAPCPYFQVLLRIPLNRARFAMQSL